MTWRGQAIGRGTASGSDIISAIFPGFLNVAASDVMANWLRIPQDFLLNNATTVYFTAKVAPSNGVKFDILKSTNNGASFSSILSTPLVCTGHVLHLTPTWVGGDLSAGDLLRIDITQQDGLCRGVLLQIVHA